MKSSLLFLFLTLATYTHAFWWPGSSDGDNALQDSSWTSEQYASAQRAFDNLGTSPIDAWSESRLRAFLLEQDIVAPSGPREQVVRLAKDRYKAYQSVANALSRQASSAVYCDGTHQASKSLSSAASEASRTASSVVTWATGTAAQANRDVMRSLEDSMDYVYSTWDDNRLRAYLEEKGIIEKSYEGKGRSELLSMMRDAYAKIADPVWEAWSDSYIHEWLVAHHIISPSPPSKYSREYLLSKMRHYYSDASDAVWSTWSDLQLKEWLVQNGIVKSNAQVKREKMLNMVQSNYYHTISTFWSAWSDSQIREWLIEHGYMRSDAQKNRDELIKLANDKYTDAAARSAAYLAWPDARLRAYLREHGVSEEMVPASRLGLLQETRIRYVQTQTRTDALWAKIKDIVNGVEAGVEDRLALVLSVLRGYKDDAYEGTEGVYESGKGVYDDVKGRAEGMYEGGQKKWEEGKMQAEAAKGKAQEWRKQARENVGEKVKVAGERIKGEL